MQSDHFDIDDPFLPATCWRDHELVDSGYVSVPPGMTVRECPDCGRLAVLPVDEGPELGSVVVTAAFCVLVLIWGLVTAGVSALLGVP